MKKGIISFDIDMTLLDHSDYRIPESARLAVSLLSKNYYVVVATGRDMDAPYSAGILDGISVDGIINQNGSCVMAGGKVIAEQFIDPSLVEALFSFAEGKPFAVGAEIGRHDCFINPQYVTMHDMIRWNVSERSFTDPALIRGEKLHSLVYFGTAAWARRIEETFPSLRLPLFSSGLGADIVDAGISKAKGLFCLCEYWGVDPQNTVAFGDSLNDLEIVQAAGIGVAMGNAVPELKKEADYITTPVGEDGVFKACAALGLINRT